MDNRRIILAYRFIGEDIKDSGTIAVGPSQPVVFNIRQVDDNFTLHIINNVFDSEIVYLTSGQTRKIDIRNKLVIGRNDVYVRGFNRRGGVGDWSCCYYDLLLGLSERLIISISDIAQKKGEDILYGGEVSKNGAFHHVKYNIFV
jgi:hypothetical protein